MNHNPQSDTVQGPNAHQQAAIDTATFLTSNLCSVLLLQPGLKKPFVNSSGTWLTLDDPDAVADAISVRSRHARCPNLGLLLHPKFDSHVVCVDIDGSSPEVISKLKALGVSRDGSNWRQITGKRNGHYHLFYHWDGELLPRIADRPDGLPIDLLSNGYAVIAPSNTSSELDGGGPYNWIEGHSPFDISPVELETPPALLIEWWQERTSRPSRSSSANTKPRDSAKAWELVKSPIGKGRRNESLTRLAGWLRQYHPSPVVETLLLAINDARCSPPLPENEVASIVRSLVKYPQHGVNGHPRALINPWKGAQ